MADDDTDREHGVQDGPDRPRGGRSAEYEDEDRGQEEGVEESFPASDPPAANVFD